MGDVSKKLMDQFAANLNTMLDEQGTGPAATAAAEPVIDVSPTTDEAAPTPTATATAEAPASEPAQPAAEPAAPTVRKIHGPAAEPVDLAGMAGPAVLKRAVPAIAVIMLLLLLLRRRR